MATDLSNIRDMLKQISKEEDKIIDALSDQTKSRKQIKTIIEASEKEIKRMNSELEESVKLTNDAGKNVDAIQEGFGHIGKLAKAPAKDLRGAATQAGSWAERMQAAHEYAKKTGVSMGALAKITGGLSGIIGKVSKGLLGWPGLVVMGIKAVLDTATKIDSYVKDLNKRFAMVRGPQIMTRDIQKQFHDFNDAIYDIRDNIRDGLKPEDVNAFMEAIDMSGKRVTTLNEGLTRYRDAVQVAAKASKVLGVTMTQSGAMMGDMMLQLNMDLKQVDRAFVEIAFDAEKSGLSTDKFWNAVKNATASLAYYGKFVNQISAATRAFTETQVQGADEAVSSVQDITQAFSKSSTQTNMAISRFAKMGGADFQKLAKNIQSEMLKQADAITVEIARREGEGKTPENVKAIEELKKKLVGIQLKKNRLDAATNKGDVALAQELAMFSGDSNEILSYMIKAINGINLTSLESGNQLEVLTRGVEALTKGAVKKETVLAIWQNAKQSAEFLKVSTKNLKKIDFKDDAMIKQNDILLAEVSDLNDSTPVESIDDMADRMASLYQISKEDAQRLLIAGSVDKKALGALQNILGAATSQDGNLGDAIDTFHAIVKGQNLGSKIFDRNVKATVAGSQIAQEAYDDTFEQIRNNTLSIEDMKKIGTDGAKWAMVSALKLDSISGWVGKMATKYLGSKPEQIEAAMKALPESVRTSIKKRGVTAVLTGALEERKKTTDQITQSQNILATLESINDKNAVTEKIAKLERKRNLNQGKEFTATDSEMLTALQGLADSKDFNEDLKRKKDFYIQQNVAAGQSLIKQDETIGQLQEIAGSSAQMSTLQAAALSDPKEQERLYEFLKTRAREAGKTSVSASDFTKGLGPDISRKMLEIAQARGEYAGVVNPALRGPKGSLGENLNFSQIKVSAGQTKQGLTMPEKVTGEGPVYLHRGESIFPAGNFKTQLMPADSGGSASGNTTNVNVSVNLPENARLKAKLQKEIADVCYKVLYEEYV